MKEFFRKFVGLFGDLFHPVILVGLVLMGSGILTRSWKSFLLGCLFELYSASWHLRVHHGAPIMGNLGFIIFVIALILGFSAWIGMVGFY